MPQIETDLLNQKAVLWAFSGYDASGEPTVSAAVEVNVRWNDGRSGGSDPLLQSINVDATAVVDREVAVGSVMWLGTLAAYNSEDPAPTIMQVVGYKATPDVKGRNYRRTVTLVKLSTELPTIV